MIKLKEENGVFYATPSFGKSGMISLLSKSQGYIVIGAHEEGINKGITFGKAFAEEMLKNLQPED